MELNREQIEHTLEICSSGDEQCAYCCLLAFDGCARKLAKLALALIRELTEENERLEDNLIKQSTENIMLLRDKQDIQADTVRKMRKKLKLKGQNMIHPKYHIDCLVVSFEDIDQTAEELLEESGE